MNLFAERDAVYKLHRDEVSPATLADLIHVCDVRMIERRRGFRFLDETAHAILVCSHLGGQNFQRHLTIEGCILGQIDFTHSPRSNRREYFVVTKPCALINLHCSSSAEPRITAADQPAVIV